MQKKEGKQISKERNQISLQIPFSLSITPMEGLLFMTFEQDPDSIYSAFEVQCFDDNHQGKGQLVIGWRVDGKVDIFHDPQLKLNPEGYDVCQGGLANMVPRNFSDSYFTLGKSGMEAHFSFQDLNGRLIDFKIRERNKKAPKPFGFLSPVGDGSEKPSSMPILMLHDFYFVRRKDTDISITIDGRAHSPDVINFPIDWTTMYFTRYTPDPLVMFFNPAYQGPVDNIKVAGETRVIKEDTTFEIDYLGKNPNLKAIQKEYKDHTIRLSFEPAFPNIFEFEGPHALGEFIIKGDLSLGEIRGNYTLTRTNEKLTITMVPSGGWIPKKERLGIRLLYNIVGIFRNWSKSYMWMALVEESRDGQYQMDSFWEKNKK